MYKIIGGDGREYGPISITQMRQWMTEGRINAQTLVQGENSTDWKALINFPELIAAQVPPAATPPGPSSRAQNLPGAEKKIAAGILGIILGSLGIHKFILGYTTEGVIMLLVTILTCFIGGFVMHIIGIIEGIIYLTKSDEDFVLTYIQNKKGWF